MGAGTDSGWVPKGTWTVQAASQPPVNFSITPSSGTGLSQTFAVTSSSTNGYSYVEHMEIIFNYGVHLGGACYLIYTPASDTVVLLNDDGSIPSQGGILGTAGTIENGQCRLNLGASSHMFAFNQVTANLVLTFKAGLPGPQKIFLYTKDAGGLEAQYQELGAWTTTTVNSQGPSAVSVAPLSGTGLTPPQPFAYVARSVNGWEYVADMTIEINASPTHTQACSVYFNRWEGLYMLDDSGAVSQFAKLGAAGALLHNSQCTVDAEHSTMSGSGTDLTLNLAVSFDPAWTGSKNHYLNVTDRGGNVTGWQGPLGSWLVALPAPSITNLAPNSGPVGTAVTITGANFGATQGSSTVTFEGVNAGTATTWSPTSIVVPVPAGATSGNVVVTVAGLASGGVSFTVTVPPSISNLSPNSGPVGKAVASPNRPVTERVIRASRFELLDGTGNGTSFWGIDKGDNVVLAFGPWEAIVLLRELMIPMATANASVSAQPVTFLSCFSKHQKEPR